MSLISSQIAEIYANHRALVVLRYIKELKKRKEKDGLNVGILTIDSDISVRALEELTGTQITKPTPMSKYSKIKFA